MAHYLQQLLQMRGPLFGIGLKKLEQATGNSGIDTKLIGDIHERAYAVMRRLGLDPKNTTSRELWAALQGKYPKDTLKDTDYVGLMTVDGVMSFNSDDARRNKNCDFAERTVSAMQQALAGEIVARYQATGRNTRMHIKALVQESGMMKLDLQDKQKGEIR